MQLASHYSIPAMYQQREFVEVDGPASYGIDFRDQYRKLGVYTGRILKDEKPADLPVQQRTKFELLINLKIANALGLAAPHSLFPRADEVVE